MLAGYRALDLTEGGAMICGRILAEWGADVVKLEKPEGSESRKLEPFYKDRSLFWFAYNSNKRGITLDIETDEGQRIFQELVKRFDLVVESYPVGYLARLHLDYSYLSKINPRVIVTSITPFGSTGPRASHKGCDLIAWAGSGYMSLCGEEDTPPVWISFFPQASLNAGAEAAPGSLMALWHRQKTGEGQHVDVSMQECGIVNSWQGWSRWYLNRVDSGRQGNCMMNAVSGVKQQIAFPCKDGYVALQVFGGGAASYVKSNKMLVEWMDEDGMAPEWLKQFDWVNDYQGTKLTQQLVDKVEGTIIKYLKTKTKQELYTRAREKGVVLLSPANDANDLASNEQLRARDYWRQVPHEELGEHLTYCGPMVKLSGATPATLRRAPLLGEHNEDIYMGELGMSKRELQKLTTIGSI